MHQDVAVNIFTKIFKKIDKQWKQLILDLKSAAMIEDESQIFMKDFIQVLDSYQVSLSKSEKNQIVSSFPGRESSESTDTMINIARIYDQKYNIMLSKMYKKVDVTAFEGLDEPEDICGYIGQTKYYRSIKKETPISDSEFLAIIKQQPRLVFDQVMSTINEIDKDHNGYVTKTEIEDILKIKYSEFFESRDLIPIIKRFSSIQNKILIDYKGFRDWVKLDMKNSMPERAKSVNGKRPDIK